jgi:hypothetical protein
VDVDDAMRHSQVGVVTLGLGHLGYRGKERRCRGIVRDRVAGVQRLGQLAPVDETSIEDLPVVESLHGSTLPRGSYAALVAASIPRNGRRTS